MANPSLPDLIAQSNQMATEITGGVVDRAGVLAGSATGGPHHADIAC